jgi:hypothetical protein
MSPSTKHLLVLGALVGIVACSGNSPIGEGGPTAGTAGTTGAAGTIGTAGTSTIGHAAGTTGIAGISGVAGTGFVTGVAGTTGAAAVGGTAGTVGNGMTASCGSFGSPTRPSGSCVTGAFKRNGVCTCQAATPNVCGDQCVDVQTDDANCGCCGNACGPTSTCNQGKCGPAAIEIVPASPGCESIDLAVEAGTLYWTDKGHGRVSSMPTTGGVVTTIAAFNLGAPSQIAVRDKSVYWAAPGAIMHATPTIQPHTITMITPNGFAVSADGAYVYYSTGTSVVRVLATTGASPVVVAREEHGGIPTALALDGSVLAYPTDLNGDVDVATLNEGKVASCGKEGPNGELLNVDCLRVARSQGSLLREKIVAQQGRVLWADGSTLKMSGTTPGSPPANDFVAGTNADFISSFATLGNMIYFSDHAAADTASGVIYKAAFARDQTAIRLARGQREPRSVVVDDKRVYWSTSDCRIMSTGL